MPRRPPAHIDAELSGHITALEIARALFDVDVDCKKRIDGVIDYFGARYRVSDAPRQRFGLHIMAAESVPRPVPRRLDAPSRRDDSIATPRRPGSPQERAGRRDQASALPGAHRP